MYEGLIANGERVNTETRLLKLTSPKLHNILKLILKQ